MGNQASEQLLKGKAYQLFVADCGQKVSSAQSEIDKGINQETQHQLKAQFHMLKGSAGFFGFEEIQRIASELESLLSKASTLSVDELRELQAKIGDLRTQQSKLPVPPSDKV